MVEGQSRSVRNDILARLIKFLQSLPKDTPVHLELASCAEDNFIVQLVDTVGPQNSLTSHISIYASSICNLVAHHSVFFH